MWLMPASRPSANRGPWLIFGEHGAGKSILRIVGNAQRFVVPFHFDDLGDRAEQFRLRDLHVVGNVRKYVRWHHQSFRLTCENFASSLITRGLDVALHAFKLFESMSGPMTVSSSSGSPYLRALTRSVNLSSNSSLTFSSTMIRFVLIQI